MQKFLVRSFYASSTIALAVALAACGGEDSPQASLALPGDDSDLGWSMADLATVDPEVFEEYDAPLPDAMPMRASFDGSYPSASAYDYAPAEEGYYENLDQSYYEPEPDADSYSWLGLASSLAGMLGDAPPDYAFDYEGVEPWVWQTGDDYRRYAEPIDGGYRYYYYEPQATSPFLVSDPYYSYGYRGDRLVVIYDRGGRVVDGRRAWRQRQAARSYYSRACDMHRAAKRRDRHGVSAPLWERHRDSVSHHRREWREARERRDQWREWERRHEPVLRREWGSEGVVRRDAERRFDHWQAAGYRDEAPRFYRQKDRKAGLQRVAEVREWQRAKAREDWREEVRAPAPSNIAYRDRASRKPETNRPEASQPELRREEPKRWTQRLRDLPEVARNDVPPPPPARAETVEQKPHVSRLEAAALREEGKHLKAEQERSVELAREKARERREMQQVARLEQQDGQKAEERQIAVREEREVKERKAEVHRTENRENARREAHEKEQARQAQAEAERDRAEKQAAQEKARQELVAQRQEQSAQERREAKERKAEQVLARQEAAREQARQAQADRKEEIREQRREARQLALTEKRAEVPSQSRPEPQRQAAPPPQATPVPKPERAKGQREKTRREFALKTGRATGKVD